MSLLTVQRPGMLTTIQDLGRVGYQAMGVPVAGPMDRWSFRLANRLVGNPDGAALLEVTLMGPTMAADRDVSVSITGAAFDVGFGDRVVRSPCVERLAAGEPLIFGARVHGARAYVAFGGGIDVAPTLGSVSTHTRGRLGGLGAGQPLRSGDRVPIGLPPSPIAPSRSIAVAGPVPGTMRHCGVLPGPEPGAWAASAFDALCHAPFDVSPESDRMGYRLRGDTTWPEGRGAIASFPTVFGAVQLPPGGGPIVLMADRQTTGGYPVVGVVGAAWWPVAGQLAPGDRVRFRAVSWDEAQEAERRLEDALDDLAPRAAA